MLALAADTINRGPVTRHNRAARGHSEHRGTFGRQTVGRQIEHRPVPLADVGPRGDPLDQIPELRVGGGGAVAIEPEVATVDAGGDPVDDRRMLVEGDREGGARRVASDPGEREEALERRRGPRRGGRPRSPEPSGSRPASPSRAAGSPRRSLRRGRGREPARRAIGGRAPRRRVATVFPRDRWSRTSATRMRNGSRGLTPWEGAAIVLCPLGQLGREHRPSSRTAHGPSLRRPRATGRTLRHRPPRERYSLGPELEFNRWRSVSRRSDQVLRALRRALPPCHRGPARAAVPGTGPPPPADRR